MTRPRFPLQYKRKVHASSKVGNPNESHRHRDVTHRSQHSISISFSEFPQTPKHRVPMPSDQRVSGLSSSERTMSIIRQGRIIETVSPLISEAVTVTVIPSTVTLSPAARGACKYRGSVATELG